MYTTSAPSDQYAPPSYSSICNEENRPGLQSVDILPRMTEFFGPVCRPEYEPFDVVVARANEFLWQHPYYTVNTCESIDVPMINTDDKIDSVWEIDTMSSVFTVYGEDDNLWMRGLRLWLMYGSSTQTCHQIGYSSFIPQVEGDRVLETFHDVMARINRTPIPGKIVTVETAKPVKWGSKEGINPDRTIWTEHGDTQTRSVNLLRIFYIKGPTQHSQIGLADFLPKEKPEKCHSPSRQFETFPAVLDQVRQWLLSVPPNYRPINVQSILVRLEFASRRKMDPRYTSNPAVMFHNCGKHLSFLRYLRVAYIIESPLDGPASRSTIQLGSRLVMPVMTKAPKSAHHRDNGELETQDSVRARLDQWVRSTGTRVVSVETVPMRVQEGGESVYGFDAMHTWNKTLAVGSGKSRSTKRCDEKFAYFYRVYTDGTVADCIDDDNRLLEYTLGTRHYPCTAAFYE